MKHVASSATTLHQNSTVCRVREYGAGTHLDIAVAMITGRYPEVGFVVNEQSEEAVYVIAGKGALTTKDATAILQPGDAIFVPAGEAYYFKGENLQVSLTCTPPWTPEQHKELG